MVRFPKKMRGCMRHSATMRRFSEVIDELCLKDLPLSGGEYTWCGGLNNSFAPKLDRFLVSYDRED